MISFLAFICLGFCLLLFSSGPVWADDTSRANALMVEAVKLLQSAEGTANAEERLRLSEEALHNLTEIVERYATTDLAVKLISGQEIGVIRLRDVRWQAEIARKNYEESLEFEETLRAAEQGDAEAQYNLAESYFLGRGVIRSVAEAYEWYYRAAIQGHEYAQSWLDAELALELVEAKNGIETEFGLKLPDVNPEAREVD